MRWLLESAGVVGALLGLGGWRALRHLGETLPRELLALLADRKLKDELVAIVLRLAGFAHLTKEARRQQALALIGEFLRGRGVYLTDQQLALLVELLYALVKRHQPQAVAPEPVRLR